MSDELRAAERLRLHREARKRPDGSPYWILIESDHDYHGWDREQMKRDADLLSDAYLAEHPADSELPVTEEWLRAVGFNLTATEVFALEDGSWALKVAFDEEGSALWLNDLWVEDCPTRGHVRRLCVALGIPLTEPPA